MTTLLSNILGGVARRVLPRSVRRAISATTQRATRWPPVGSVDLGDLRRTTVISDDWGFDRGTPIDRYFIKEFMRQNSGSIQGRVLEIDTNRYSREFGGGQITQSDILHQSEYLPGITMVGDLTDGRTLPSNTFDCAIVTQTLQLIYDPAAAVRTLHRILKPGGKALCTFPGISRITADPEERWGYFWSFTTLSARRLFRDIFGDDGVEVVTFGNVLSATAFLYGLAAQELEPDELERRDPDIQLLIAVVATKAASM